MKTVITISYNPTNSQSEELTRQEIGETIGGLLNSLRTQVNDVRFTVENFDE